MTAVTLPAWARPKEIFDLVRLAAPVAVSRASFMLMSLTDAIVLARHAPGELPLVLNAWLPNGVFMGFGLGLMMGVSVLTAELNGSGKGQETGRIFRRGLVLAVIYSIAAMAVTLLTSEPLFRLVGFDGPLAAHTAVTTNILAFGMLGHMGGTVCSFYLEALRRPNIVTAVSMSAVVVNLTSALILVPEYGAVGVVWGTTLSRFYMMAVFLVIVWRVTPAFRKAPKGPEAEARRQNTVGLGTGIANIAEWGGFNLTFIIATNATLAGGMLMGDTIYGLAVQVMAVVFMTYVGLGTATSVRVAERFGRGEGAGVREAARLGVVASVIMGLLIAALIVLLREPISIVMLNGSDAASAGAKLVPILAAMMAAVAFVTIFDGLQGVASMAMRAQGIVWIPTSIHIGSYALLMLPLCWWLALHQGHGVWGVVVGISIASVVAGLAQVLALEWVAARSTRIGQPRAA